MEQTLKDTVSSIFKDQSSPVAAEASLFVELLTMSASQKRPVILVTRSGEELAARLKNLHFFAQNQSRSICSMPWDERTVMHATSADPLLRMERTATRFFLSCGDMPDMLVIPPDALLEKCIAPKDLLKHAQIITSQDKIERELLLSSLSIMGYTKVTQVSDRGTFAVRGSIIDIFINGEKQPLRIDLFGDVVESIKYFDENTQRSGQSLKSIIIGPAREIFLDDDTKALAIEKLIAIADIVNYPTNRLNEKLKDIENSIHFYGMEKLLPAFFKGLSSVLEIILESFDEVRLPHIIFDDREYIFEQLRSHEHRIEELHQQALIRGDLLFDKDQYFLQINELEDTLRRFSSTDIKTHGRGQDALTFPCHDTLDIRQDILKASVYYAKDEEPHLLKPLAERIKKLHGQEIATIIAVSSITHEQELKKLLMPFGINLSRISHLPLGLEQHGKEIFRPHIHAHVFVSKKPLAFGAVFDFLHVALIAEEDIFGKRTKRKDKSGKQLGFKTTISDLEPDDLVVHVDHGMGRFKGLVRLNLRGVDNDYILLTYDNDEKLYLPVHRINLIKPHGALKDGTTRLDKLGGNVWASKKKKVKEAVMAMAQDLLKLYAKRELTERPPFVKPDAHYLEFEASFEFETTQDQQKAIDDVLADMQKKRPMDRLVCGDVGYGKTEVAMRAAMLASLSNRQVAILAPTTVLAQQHGITFKERFKNTGINIAVLSRFQKPKEVKQILEDLSNHKVDVVIGTHRLLSSDVIFKDLGLLVIDEEQRFGIRDKEHLKRMRTKVDVLAMSATPIPRTMQMSYFGIRDLSIIETPPIDRRAIETEVIHFDDAVIKEAILRELSRGGQVYFVHNRIQSIEATAEYIRALVPNARILVAHGQMGEKDLEDIMLKFMKHEINVLVSTTIIETGIDVSTANTMFIDNADDFGLSQLYQLRGRIGRSKERAFAYLLTRQNQDTLSPIAKKRLEILHKFSRLGAGFRIAQHDLELRGAGDLLGKNQHGHMAAVGSDLYAELLQEAVKKLKGMPEEEAIEPEVSMPISALISEKYCPDLHERMNFYQKLANANNTDELDSAILELEDLYGEAPDEVLALRACTLIKIELRKIRALKLEIHRKEEKALRITISLLADAQVDHDKAMQAMKDPEEAQMRITPQNKVIQRVMITDEDLIAASLKASLEAIENIKRRLF